MTCGLHGPDGHVARQVIHRLPVPLPGGIGKYAGSRPVRAPCPGHATARSCHAGTDQARPPRPASVGVAEHLFGVPSRGRVGQEPARRSVGTRALSSAMRGHDRDRMRSSTALVTNGVSGSSSQRPLAEGGPPWLNSGLGQGRIIGWPGGQECYQLYLPTGWSACRPPGCRSRLTGELGIRRASQLNGVGR